MESGDATVRACSPYGKVWKIHPKILVEKPEGKKPIWRPKRKQENNIKINLKVIGSVDDWILLAQDRLVIMNSVGIVKFMGFHKR